MVIAGGIFGLAVSFAFQLIMRLGFPQWSAASAEVVVSIATALGLFAGATVFACLLFMNPGLGEMVGRYTLTGCCGVFIVALVIGLISRLWSR